MRVGKGSWQQFFQGFPKGHKAWWSQKDLSLSANSGCCHLVKCELTIPGQAPLASAPLFCTCFYGLFCWLILAHRGAQMAVLSLRLIQCWSQLKAPCCPQFWCLLNLIFSGWKEKEHSKRCEGNVDFLLFPFYPWTALYSPFKCVMERIKSEGWKRQIEAGSFSASEVSWTNWKFKWGLWKY